MKQIAWCAFQISIFSLMMWVYVSDPDPIVAKHAGSAVMVSALMSVLATIALIGAYDLFVRLSSRLRQLLRVDKGADRVSLSLPAARTGRDLPQQISRPRIGHDPGKIV